MILIIVLCTFLDPAPGRNSCSKQEIIVQYGTLSTDSLELEISQARKIMDGLVDIARDELKKACSRKATIRLGLVTIDKSSSTYQISGTLEYLVKSGYDKWDFITCAKNAAILDDVVKDVSKVPAIQGDYSKYSATSVKKMTSQDRLICCPVGSVLISGSRCGKFRTRHRWKSIACDKISFEEHI